MEEYDLIVIGAGPGGYEACAYAAEQGMKCAIVERAEAGGTCLNRGCIPTKTLLHASQTLYALRHGEPAGVTAGEVTADFAALKTRKEEVVETLRNGVHSLLQKTGVTWYAGTGTITAPDTVTVSGEEEITLRTKRILIATGAKPVQLPVPGADGRNVLSSDTLLADPRPFASLAIIGGGVIGVEFATFYSDLGCRVTIIEALGNLLSGMDKEAGTSVRQSLKKRGVGVLTSTTLREIRDMADGQKCCVCTEKETPREVVADAVLIAVGRKPCTDGLFGEGIAPATERGAILVNESFETDVPGVYAIGDVTGRVQLAHAASAQGRVAVRRMLGKEPDQRLDLIPSCIYTHPEIAFVGMTAEEAVARGITAESKKYPMSANGKSVLTAQERGFVKLICESGTGKLLGALLLCDRATDLVTTLSVAMANDLTAEEAARAIFPHPTFSEGIAGALRLWTDMIMPI